MQNEAATEVPASDFTKFDDLTYILDEPSSQDRFGSHTEIANAITTTLENQSQIRVVGLLGRWGTGKSTIVRHLTSALEEKNKYVVFTYDAWAHQGDPATRSILEELIDRIVTLKPAAKKRWEKTLSEISGSTESSSTTTTTRLSAWGKLLFVLLVLLPLFLAFIDGDTLRLIFSDSPNGVSRALVIGIMIYGFVIIATFIAAYASTMQTSHLKDTDLKSLDRIKRFASSGEDLLSIILTRNFPANSSTTLRKSQPTAIEFRKYLREIITSQRPKRIVFVIDNLDRIGPREALSLWSIIVGMVTDETHRLDAKIEPVVILPFDPIALEALVASGDNPHGHDISDLIEKSIDVTFEVPPPVLSNWRLYFIEQYENCGLFGASGNSIFERYWTLRNFEIYLGQTRITPRKINRFINRIISLSAQQVETFGPSILSYFIANEEAIRLDCLAFLKSHSPGFDDTREWQLKIAAIAFGTTEAEAAQVLLRDELFVALRDRDRAAFSEATQVGGFAEVVRNFVEEPTLDPNGAVDPAPLTALAAFSGGAEFSVDDQILWTLLFRSWKVAAFPATADILAQDAINAFIKNVPDLVRAENDFVFARVLSEIKEETDPGRLKGLVNVGDAILSLLPTQSDARVSVGKDLGLLLRILGSAGPNSNFAALVGTQSTFADAAEYVISLLNGPFASLAPEQFALIADRVKNSQIKGDRQEFFKRAGEGLKAIFENAESSDQSLISASVLLASKSEGQFRFQQVFKELEEAGNLRSAVFRALDSEAHAVVGAIVALQLTLKQMPSEDELSRLDGWLTTEENASRLIASLRRINTGAFLTVLHNLEVQGNNVDRLLKPILTKAVRDSSLGSRVHTLWLLKNFRKAAGWLNVAETSAYAKSLSGISDFATQVKDLADDAFLLILEKIELATARTLLSQRIAEFSPDRLARSVMSGDAVWQAYRKLEPDLGSELGSKSNIFEALHSVLSGSSGNFGVQAAARALRIAPLVGEASFKQLIRSVVSKATEEGNTDALLVLFGLEGFHEYMSRPSVAAGIIGTHFPTLCRSRPGQSFIDRNAQAILRIEIERRVAIEEMLMRMLRFKDPETVEWAKLVLRKLDVR